MYIYPLNMHIYSLFCDVCNPGNFCKCAVFPPTPGVIQRLNRLRLSILWSIRGSFCDTPFPQKRGKPAFGTVLVHSFPFWNIRIISVLCPYPPPSRWGTHLIAHRYLPPVLRNQKAHRFRCAFRVSYSVLAISFRITSWMILARSFLGFCSPVRILMICVGCSPQRLAIFACLIP